MKTLIVGCGSMGKRRVRCLVANGIEVKYIRGMDHRADRRDAFGSLGVEAFDDLADGLHWGPDLVICSLPELHHVEVCRAAAQAGAHFFCEAPLSIRGETLDELAQAAQRKNVIGAVGAQLPFHPAVQQAKRWIDETDIGSPRMILFDFSTNLPRWHPYEKVSDFYEPGHMIALIDLMLSKLWWLQDGGVPVRTCAQFARLSGVKMEGGDALQAMAATNDGGVMTVHLAMVQRSPRNLLRITGENGGVEIDMIAGRARRLSPGGEPGDAFSPPDDFDYEQTYVDEIAHLLRRLRGEATWHYELDRAIRAARFYDAIFRSAQTGRWEDVV